MSRALQENGERELRELERKNVVYYSVLLQAWIGTRMERDRTLVTLSAAGIGLLVTILTTVGVKHSWELLLHTGAVAGFLVAIWSSLVIYQLNSEHIEDAIRGSSERDPKLERYDKTSLRAFLIGAALSVCVGLASGLNHLIDKGDTQMAQDQTSQGQQSRNDSLTESLNGLANLAPQEPLTKSLDGITNLKPQGTQPVAGSGQSASQVGMSATNAPTSQQQGPDRQ